MFFLKKLSSISQVLKILQNVRDLLSKFDNCIKRKTTLSPHEIGNWETTDIKGAFTKDVIPFFKNLRETFKLFEKGLNDEVKEMKDIFKQLEDEVDQCFVAKKCFETENKGVRNEIRRKLRDENNVRNALSEYSSSKLKIMGNVPTSMRETYCRWIELFSDYDCEIRYHPGKANVVADALSRRILQKGLDEMIEQRSDGTLYYLDRIWVPLKGEVRTLIMDEAHKSKYSVHPEADKMYYDLRDMYWWPGMKKDIA
ncbi:putative reverse transcriptase domain-containing protein [Tanacetum coccineum]